MRKLLLAIASACIATAHADAATFTFSFTSNGNTVLASGTLTTSDTLNALGGYEVTSIVGTANGEAIVSFDSDPYTPAAAYASLADGSVTATPLAPGHSTGFDNVIFTTGAVALDSHGLVFLTADDIFNVFNVAGTTGNDIFGYSALSENPVFTQPPRGAFAIEAVPEPASWTMMIGGLGLIGAARRRKISLSFC